MVDHVKKHLFHGFSDGLGNDIWLALKGLFHITNLPPAGSACYSVVSLVTSQVKRFSIYNSLALEICFSRTPLFHTKYWTSPWKKVKGALRKRTGYMSVMFWKLKSTFPWMFPFFYNVKNWDKVSQCRYKCKHSVLKW